MRRNSAKPRVGETSTVIANELRAMLKRKEFEDRLRGIIEAQLRDKARNEAWKKELEEKLPGIRERYPNITEEESALLPMVEFNKLSIAHQQKLIKSYKELLQQFFKEHKTWIANGAPEEDIEWYKDLLRDSKNSLESSLKETVKSQEELRWQKSIFDK
jgi:hypothetical protein